MRSLVENMVKEKLADFLEENPAVGKIIIEKALMASRARLAARKAREATRKTPLGSSALPGKLTDCIVKDPSKTEIYIVEGDSAMSSCKLGRNAEFQAIIPVRGKTLNCMKSSYDKIFASDIIVDLIRVIGCGVEMKSSKKSDIGNFDLKQLKWSKIIICTDADVDGFQIRTLLLTLFYRLLPTLIEEGKIFIAESPLFEITAGDDTYFAYDEQEKNDIVKKLGNQKYTLQRSKGLGENNPDMMWQTTMCPQTRRLIAVTSADAEATTKMFDVLLGDALADRKKFINEFGHLYVKDADV
jgi:DNA gyrase subunit B